MNQVVIQCQRPEQLVPTLRSAVNCRDRVSRFSQIVSMSLSRPITFFGPTCLAISPPPNNHHKIRTTKPSCDYFVVRQVFSRRKVAGRWGFGFLLAKSKCSRHAPLRRESGPTANRSVPTTSHRGAFQISRGEYHRGNPLAMSGLERWCEQRTTRWPLDQKHREETQRFHGVGGHRQA